MVTQWLLFITQLKKQLFPPQEIESSANSKVKIVLFILMPLKYAFYFCGPGSRWENWKGTLNYLLECISISYTAFSSLERYIKLPFRQSPCPRSLLYSVSTGHLSPRRCSKFPHHITGHNRSPPQIGSACWGCTFLLEASLSHI